jgi:hypothetical protein
MLLDIVAGAEGERGLQGVCDGHAWHPLQRSAQDYRGTHRILPYLYTSEIIAYAAQHSLAFSVAQIYAQFCADGVDVFSGLIYFASELIYLGYGLLYCILDLG